MTDVLPFTPGQLVKLTAGSSTASYSLPTAEWGRQIVIYVEGAYPVIFKLASAAASAVVPDSDPATAGTGAFVVAPGTTQTFTLGDQTVLAYIRDGAGDSVFYLATGMGA